MRNLFWKVLFVISTIGYILVDIRGRRHAR